VRKLTRQERITAVAVAVLVAVFAAVITYQVQTAPEKADADEVATTVVRADSHRLDTAEDDKVTLVEFLDFECESCRAAFPFVEQVRQQYEGRITFVIRYFPIDSHRNAMNAAKAVEAAARQDRLEPMYERMYETQAEWGEQQDSKATLFRTFAEDLGLDMDQYDRDVASDDVEKRIERDVADGLALGVGGTPTFFLNGKKLQPASTDEFIAAIDDALAR
jgi:protein-disulfide isomerase